MDKIAISFYNSGKVTLLDLLFPDAIERAATVTLLVRQQRFFELDRLDTKVDKDITKEQLNKDLAQLQLWNYKLV